MLRIIARPFRCAKNWQARSETYNIGGNNQYTNLEIVNIICDILDRLHSESKFCPHSKLINFVKDRPGHDRRYAMDIKNPKGKRLALNDNL